MNNWFLNWYSCWQVGQFCWETIYYFPSLINASQPRECKETALESFTVHMCHKTKCFLKEFSRSEIRLFWNSEQNKDSNQLFHFQKFLRLCRQNAIVYLNQEYYIKPSITLTLVTHFHSRLIYSFEFDCNF